MNTDAMKGKDPTQKQALYLRELLTQAGYDGNPVSAREQAGADLLDMEIHWDRAHFSHLIDALEDHLDI